MKSLRSLKMRSASSLARLQSRRPIALTVETRSKSDDPEPLEAFAVVLEAAAVEGALEPPVAAEVEVASDAAVDNEAGSLDPPPQLKSDMAATTIVRRFRRMD
jgi:hypothetical protein